MRLFRRDARSTVLSVDAHVLSVDAHVLSVDAYQCISRRSARRPDALARPLDAATGITDGKVVRPARQATRGRRANRRANGPDGDPRVIS